jgi:hypothetical protein
VRWGVKTAVTVAIGTAILGAGAATSIAGHGAGALRIKPGRYNIARLGSFRPNRHADLGHAIRAFGRPSRIHHGHRSGCKVTWKDKRLKIDFENYGVGHPCSKKYGLAQSVVIKRSRRWSTTKHLRVGQSVNHLKRKYPGASNHGAYWWLRTAYSNFGEGGNYPVLAARVHRGRVAGFKGWVGAAGE